MLNNVSLQERLTEGDHQIINHVLSDDHSDSFASIVETLKLDPTKDLRGADLRDVDLSYADLRGYDFTGADLRGAFGSDVQWDGTTIFHQANVEQSLFALSKALENFFNENPRLVKEIDRIGKGYWADTANWVAEHLKSSKNKRNALMVAMALFRKTESTVVRSSILHYVARYFDEVATYLAFLVEVMSKPNQEPLIVRSALGILIRHFHNESYVYQLLVRTLKDEEVSYRSEAIVGVVYSQHYENDIKRVSLIMKNESQFVVRRSFINAVNRRYVTRKILSSSFPDYINAISSRELRTFIWNNVLFPESEKITENERLSRGTALLNRMKQFGVPYVLNW